MKSDDSAVMTCLGIVVYAIFIGLLSVFLNAWALTTLWGWIMVPTFHLSPLLYWQAFGIMSIVAFMVSTPTTTGAEKAKSMSDVIGMSLVNAVGKPLFSVVFVWLFLRMFGAF